MDRVQAIVDLSLVGAASMAAALGRRRRRWLPRSRAGKTVPEARPVRRARRIAAGR
jgi:hypothetical protein